MALSDSVPSNALDVLKRNAEDLDKALNSTSNFQNRIGNTLVPVPSALSQVAIAVDSATSAISFEVNNVKDSAEEAISLMDGYFNAAESAKASALSSISADVNEVEQAKNLAVQDLIPAKISELGLKYPPISYEAGLPLNDHTQTYLYDDVVYVWGGDLSTVSTGNFDEVYWAVVQSDVLGMVESYSNSIDLASTTPLNSGQRAENRERGNAQYELAEAGYTASDGDVTAANGRVWSLIVNDCILSDWLGCVGDAVYSESGSISSGSNTLTDSSVSFSSDDVGKVISIYEAGVTPNRLNTTITAVNSGTSVTLAASATATPSGGAKYVYGTDNAESMNRLMALASSLKANVKISGGNYLLNSRVSVPSNLKITGAGKGVTTIYHPQTQAFFESENGVSNVTFEHMTGNACASADGFVAMSGASKITVQHCEVLNIKNLGVTVGVAFDKVDGVDSKTFRVLNCDFDVADYGVVFDSSVGNGVISDCEVSGCTMNTYWGSCVSISGEVHDVTVDGNRMYMLGIEAEDSASGGATAGQGLCVKIWNGSSETVKPKNITVTNNVMNGLLETNTFQAVSTNNHADEVIISNNTVDGCEYVVFTNFSNTGDGLNVVGNTVRDCGWLLYTDNSSNYKPLISNNQVIDCRNGVRTSLEHAHINNNRFENIENGCISLNNPCRFGSISDNTFVNVGESVIDLLGTGSNSQLLSIADNVMTNVCNKIDSTYDAISLNDQAHIITGNIIQSDGENRPRYIIGGTGTNRLINSNWMFGGVGYLETAAASSDVYIGNKERGL